MCLGRRSYEHRDFENPHAETCWLSSLFQALWHSAVFHHAFDDRLAGVEPAPEERLLRALYPALLQALLLS